MLALHEIRNYSSEFRVNVSLSKCFRFRAHWHREIELIYILKGRTIIGVNSEVYALEQGDLFLCYSGDIHYYTGEGSAKLILLIFAPELLEKELQTGQLLVRHIQNSELREKGIHQEVQEGLKRIYKEFTGKQLFYKTALRGEINRLIYTLKRYLPCGEQQSAADTKQRLLLSELGQFLEYMEQHFGDRITLDQAAQRMHFSPWYFSKMFKKLTGRGFVSYLNGIRIQKAMGMIQDSTDNMIEIAMGCGFENLRTFNRVFKQQTGTTPGSVRKNAHGN